MQILALRPFRGAPELQELLAGLAMALPDLIQLVTDDSPAPDLTRPLLLPYLAPHRLLESHASSPDALLWSVYAELRHHRGDPRRSAPALAVNLERFEVARLVGWLLEPDQPSTADVLPPIPPPDPLAALLTLHLLRDQPVVLAAHAALEHDGDSYIQSLQHACTIERLLPSYAHHRLLETDLAEQQHRLEQERQDLGHVLEDRDLLARQLNELHASFETFHEKASSDAGKLDWNRKRRAELELTLQLQQRELEALARQVKEQATLIQRGAAASEQMMQLVAGVLAD